MPFKVTVVTLFPEAFPGLLGMSVLGRGQRDGRWQLEIVNIRDFASDKHKTVDDTPYGGGAGMLLKPDIVAAALRKAKADNPGALTVYMGPAGPRFVQPTARRMATGTGLIVLCGHYEGVDERVLEAEVDEVVSVGDFVLSGGENAAMVVVDAVVRLLPGVLGADASLHEESFDIEDEGVVLVEYPHYTRPVEWEGRVVPEVLRNGHHGEIKKWRLAEAKRRTAKLKG
ncbi:MAG: tRNA (guanosine(37)-N1)-methyltransferase TrmD [Alphaproteobacteria bacterium]|nr:MAG: tRNA (guanosine(37)-N1)-methyltransferase TrmD [Alphaproteobacteria bacterium]